MHGEFEHLLKGALRLAHRGKLFLGDQPFPLQAVDTFLIGGDDAGAGCLHDAVKKAFDLLFDFPHLAAQLCGYVFSLSELSVPFVLEHGPDDVEQAPGRPQAVEKPLKLALDNIAPDGFAVAHAVPIETHVIGMALGLSLGPAGRKRFIAITADNGASKREVRIQVPARGYFGTAC